MSKNVKTETFAEMWKETEAELLSEGSVDDTDNVVTSSHTDEEGQSEVDDGKPSVFGELEEGGQSEKETKLIDIPGYGSFSEEEIKAGMMKDKDYRQKTEDLANQRKELEKAEALWEALQEDPVETVKRLARDIQEGVIEPRETPSTGSLTQARIDEIVAAKVQEALEKNEGLADMKVERATKAVNAVFDKIEKSENVTLGAEDRAFVIRKAQELGTTDLPFVFAGLIREVDQVNAARSNAKATSTQTSHRNDDLPEDQKKPKGKPSFKEAAAEAAKELGFSLAGL